MNEMTKRIDDRVMSAMTDIHKIMRDRNGIILSKDVLSSISTVVHRELCLEYAIAFKEGADMVKRVQNEITEKYK